MTRDEQFSRRCNLGYVHDVRDQPAAPSMSSAAVTDAHADQPFGVGVNEADETDPHVRMLTAPSLPSVEQARAEAIARVCDCETTTEYSAQEIKRLRLERDSAREQFDAHVEWAAEAGPVPSSPTPSSEATHCEEVEVATPPAGSDIAREGLIQAIGSRTIARAVSTVIGSTSQAVATPPASHGGCNQCGYGLDDFIGEVCAYCGHTGTRARPTIKATPPAGTRERIIAVADVSLPRSSR